MLGEVTADVGVALRHGVERVAGAGVLLDDIPLGSGLFRGLNDGLPGAAAIAVFRDHATAKAAMQQRLEMLASVIS